MRKQSLLRQLVNTISPAQKRLYKKQAEIAMQIGKILRSKGISQRALAKMLDKEESYLSRILTGDTNLTLKTITEIEDALGANIIITPREIESEFKNIDKMKFLLITKEKIKEISVKSNEEPSYAQAA